MTSAEIADSTATIIMRFLNIGVLLPASLQSLIRISSESSRAQCNSDFGSFSPHCSQRRCECRVPLSEAEALWVIVIAHMEVKHAMECRDHPASAADAG